MDIKFTITIIIGAAILGTINYYQPEIGVFWHTVSVGFFVGAYGSFCHSLDQRSRA